MATREKLREIETLILTLMTHSLQLLGFMAIDEYLGHLRCLIPSACYIDVTICEFLLRLPTIFHYSCQIGLLALFYSNYTYHNEMLNIKILK